MTRGVCWYLVGSLVLLVLAGCGRSWFEEREPWRHEAEEKCLSSGAVKEGPAVTLMRPIQGPGVCGADFPLHVAALGEAAPLGYADEPRPPDAIPQLGYPAGYPRAPASSNPVRALPPVAPAPYPSASEPSRPTAAQHPYLAPSRRNVPPPSAGGPISLTPPGLEPPADRLEGGSYANAPPNSNGSPAYPRLSPQWSDDARPPGLARPSAPTMTVPLGPAHLAPLTTRAATASVTPAATLACPLVFALDHWVTGAVQPSALRWFGQQVVEIRQISAYSCRGMNGNANAHISEHAFGNALDIAAFTLADGRKITVKDGWHGAPEEQGFLRDIEAAACTQFSTVLAPGSNVYHYDHIHVDLMRRASGSRICNPAAISGEVAAAQARVRYGGRPYGVTGSIGSPRASPADDHLGYAAEPDDVDDDRPHGLPRRH